VPHGAEDLNALLGTRFSEGKLYFSADGQIGYRKQVHTPAADLNAQSVNTSAASRYLNGAVEPVPLPAAPVGFGEQWESKRHGDRVTIAQLA
jgi:hypothetical protein